MRLWRGVSCGVNEPCDWFPAPEPAAGKRGVKSPLISFFDLCALGDFFPLGTPGVDACGTLAADNGVVLYLLFNSGVLGPEDFAEFGCLILFLSFIVSVLRLIGLGRPWSLRNNPQALHNTWPVSSLLQSGVVWVLQLRHTGLVMLDLAVVVPLVIWAVAFAFGCTGGTPPDGTPEGTPEGTPGAAAKDGAETEAGGCGCAGRDDMGSGFMASEIGSLCISEDIAEQEFFFSSLSSTSSNDRKD